MSARRKLSGPAALTTLGNGWTDMPDVRQPFSDGPDVVLYLDADEDPGRFGDVTVVRPAPVETREDEDA